MRRPLLLPGLVVAVTFGVGGCGTLRDVPLPGLVSGPTYGITGIFNDALGLPEQAAVKMDGATIGEIEHITTVDYTATVTMRILDEFPVPADVRAEVRFASPMGDAFIELTDPKGGGDAMLSDGGVIPVEATSEAPSIGNLLSATSTLLTGGSFADMKVVITELNTALRGNGGNIHKLLGQLDGMVTRLNAHTEQFDVALTSMDRLSKNLAGDRELLGESLAKLEPAVRTLSGQRKQIFTLMAELRRLSSAGTATINGTRDDMLSILKDLGPVLDTLSSNQRNFEQILGGIRDFGEATDSATFGLFLNFDLTTIFDQDVLPAAPRTAPDSPRTTQERGGERP